MYCILDSEGDAHPFDLLVLRRELALSDNIVIFRERLPRKPALEEILSALGVTNLDTPNAFTSISIGRQLK
jgi:hypothetical protein